MLRFLRYNSRHRLWWPRGYKDRWWPQLDPIESSSHGKNHKRTWSLDEPRWFYRLRQRLFCVVGHHRCPDRATVSPVHLAASRGRAPDTWDVGPDWNRTCSYCGSIHPDDLMAICRKVPHDVRYGVVSTSKVYKVYVRQPGVRNASEGAIKFYMWHTPANPSKRDQADFATATRITRERLHESMHRLP